MRKSFILILFILLGRGSVMAIIPALEREVNLTFINEKISSVLNKIQDQTGIIFSYQPSILNDLPAVTLQLKHKTVREALALMLPKTITFKPKNNYIILKERPAEDTKKTEISGYVVDKTTDEKVANVTIYDKESLQSVTTNEYGYYTISVPNTNEKLSVNKENYRDTALAITEVKNSQLTNIDIHPVSETQRKRDSLYWKEKLNEIGVYTNKVFKKVRGYVNSVNIRDTITRNFQVSLFPFIGTNHKLSGSVINKLSFNIYGGFAKGLNGFEMGGLFNIDRENVRGMQMAGLFNLAGDSLHGTQLAGYFNITGKAAYGFQAAGLANINAGRQKGVQVAGLLNVNKSVKGVSFAGLMNICGSVSGAQIAALGNINDTLTGGATACVFNISKHVKSGVQVAGLFNVADGGRTNVQVAGLFNKADYVKGVQIGLFNFSDSVSGVPIGLLSFVKKGVHQVELSTDELFQLNLSFRTGAPSFYNIFSGGIRTSASMWQVGYGVGTSFKITNKWRTDFTATFHHLSNGGFYLAASDLYRFYLGFEYKVGKKFSIAAGPTFNIYISDTYEPEYDNIYSHVAPYGNNSTNSYGFNTSTWFGGRVALRFL
jgi:hypothetical protein